MYSVLVYDRYTNVNTGSCRVGIQLDIFPTSKHTKTIPKSVEANRWDHFTTKVGY